MAFQTALLPVSLTTVVRSRATTTRDAFHRLTCSDAFQDLVAASAEAWPSVANTVLGSWKATSTRREARPVQTQVPNREAHITVSLTSFHPLAQIPLMLKSTSSTQSQIARISFATTMLASHPICQLALMDWRLPTFDPPLPTCRPSRWLLQPAPSSNNPPSVSLHNHLSVPCGACSRHLPQQQHSVPLVSR